jgi:integrase
MLEALINDPRSRGADHVLRLYDGKVNVTQLHDAFLRGDLKGLRDEGNDPDVSARVADWLEWITKVGFKRGPVRERTCEDYGRMVRSLIPEGRPFRLSRLTPQEVNAWLVRIDAESRATRNRYFNALRGFIKYLRQQGILERDPLNGLEAPSNSKPRDEYMRWEYVQAVLAAMPDGDAKSVVALAFGSGMEWSALSRLAVADVIDASGRKLWAPGTKTHHRGRPVVVEEWAWPFVERQLRGKVGRAKLFHIAHGKVLDAFYDAQIAAGWVTALPNEMTARQARKKRGYSIRGRFHTLHDCRHTYTVHRLTGEDGGERRDPQSIADQLGHADTQCVVRVYGKVKRLIDRHSPVDNHARGQKVS